VSAASPSTVVRDHSGIDAAWDALVERSPGGHHVQTSRWAEVKGTVGWRALRIAIERDGRPVGGCQVLVRNVGPARVAYVPRGPVFDTAATDDDRLAVLAELARTAARRRFLHLKVQPPAGASGMVEMLESHGYRHSKLETAPTATVLVDASRSGDDLIAAMRTNARRNLRRARREGVVVRDGGAGDLPTLVGLIGATAERQGFEAYPARYYEEMWRAFGADGHAHLLVAERDGTALSAVLLIAFGDTVIYKIGGWSGEPRSIRPNELIHWHATEWTRTAGYRWYDLEGIDLPVAEAIIAGEEPPETAQAGVSHFKLGFGGDVTIFPPAYDRVAPGPLGRLTHRLAVTVERAAPLAARVLGRGA
jgi:lipid II:glycine glycyltransferase (peptidoglycan interpeptide bridge formation enzyme)